LHAFNPAAIIIGGTLSRAEDHLMAGLRGLFHQRALPFGARGLEVARAEPDTCALLGTARVVINAEFAVRAGRSNAAPPLVDAVDAAHISPGALKFQRFGLQLATLFMRFGGHK
jgi:hypothetical protein